MSEDTQDPGLHSPVLLRRLAKLLLDRWGLPEARNRARFLAHNDPEHEAQLQVHLSALVQFDPLAKGLPDQIFSLHPPFSVDLKDVPVTTELDLPQGPTYKFTRKKVLDGR